MTAARVKRASHVRLIIGATMKADARRQVPRGCKDGVVQMHATDHPACSLGMNR